MGHGAGKLTFFETTVSLSGCSIIADVPVSLLFALHSVFIHQQQFGLRAVLLLSGTRCLFVRRISLPEELGMKRFRVGLPCAMTLKINLSL